jgi:predicted DNA-binding transcriptional regulator AlpA
MSIINNKYISIDELEFLLDLGRRSFYSTEGFPKPSFSESKIDYFSKEEIENYIGTKLDEKFIEIEEVSEITGKTAPVITKYAANGFIPAYQVKKGSKGSKFLFKKSEILVWNEKYTNPVRDYAFFDRLFFTKGLQSALKQTLYHSTLENYLNKQQIEVLRLVWDGDFTMDFIGTELGLTRERVRQIFTIALNKILRVSSNFGSVELENIKLKKENTRLQNELNLIKRQIDYTNSINNASIEENVEVSYLNTLVEKFSIVIKYDNDVSSYLSVRALNIVGGHDMETIGDLVSFGKKRIRGLRNLGKKTIQEFDEVLHNLGLKFIDEYNDHDQLLVIKKAIQLAKNTNKIN